LDEKEGTGMKAKVMEELCIGCGLCASICPEVFEMRDDMIAKVIVDQVPAAAEPAAQDAASSCPVEAIVLTD
jgi:ferredoxin